MSALGLEGVGSGVGGARREVAGGPGGGVGRGAAALGVDSARQGAGGGGGSEEEVGVGPWGPWRGARRRPGAAAAAAAAGCFRARHAPARAPAWGAGGSRGRAGAWPRSARRRFALPAAPGAVAVAAVVAHRGERSLRSEVVWAPGRTGPGIFFFFISGITPSLTRCTSGARVPHTLSFDRNLFA